MSNREAQILHHMRLVTFVVNRLSTDRVSTLGLEREDAISYGTEGLIQAIDGFDEGRGTSFSSFAIQRIRGAILDAVRRQDPLPRSLRRSTRRVEQAAQELASQLGRWPTKKELAMKLGMGVREVQRIQQHASSRFVSLEQVLFEGPTNGGGSRSDPADTDDRGDPAIAAEHEASLELLRDAVSRLSDRDRAILQFRYSEARPFHEVGRLLGLSESRVCQLHKRIIRQLRQQLMMAWQEAA